METTEQVTRLIVVDCGPGRGFTVCEADELGSRVALSGPYTDAGQAGAKMRELRAIDAHAAMRART